MRTVNDIRKALKPLGYNVRTKTFSFGRSMHFINNSTKERYPSIFTTAELEEWKPLIDWLNDNVEEINAIKKSIR